jgi:hypothetical protein
MQTWSSGLEQLGQCAVTAPACLAHSRAVVVRMQCGCKGDGGGAGWGWRPQNRTRTSRPLLLARDQRYLISPGPRDDSALVLLLHSWGVAWI